MTISDECGTLVARLKGLTGYRGIANDTHPLNAGERPWKAWAPVPSGDAVLVHFGDSPEAALKSLFVALDAIPSTRPTEPPDTERDTEPEGTR